mgnify:CR=1 FL=1
MKRKIFAAALTAVLCLSMSACGQSGSPHNESESEPTAPDSIQDTRETSDTLRNITDLGGNEVQIPAISEIKRVVVISPPVMSFVVETIPDTEMIKGISSRAFTTSNTEIVEKVFPLQGNRSCPCTCSDRNDGFVPASLEN